MKIPKDHAMLIDIQYIRPNRKENTPDYLYIIWKDLKTKEKYVSIIQEPMMTIFFEKPEYRNHTYNKNYARIDECESVNVKYKDIVYTIAKDMGDRGKERLEYAFSTRNLNILKEFLIYPYVFGADYDIRTFYRYMWKKSMENRLEKPITKGFLDIEVDSFESTGFANPAINPIDLITFINTDSKTSYTFCLTGVDYKNKLIRVLSEKDKKNEERRKELYSHRMKEQEYWKNNSQELIEKIHQTFDESYPGYEYKLYFYTNEAEMIVHLFQLINTLKLDFIGVWNISFDIPYIISRLKILGLDPAEVMCHPDFPSKECYFKKDTINFAVKNKSDFFHISSFSIFFDQMINYAAIRKGRSELRSNKLTQIAEKEIGDEKLDYSEYGNIKTLSYNNYLLYILYNIKDVLLQVGIEEITSDVETYYLTSYKNLTPYESVFKQTVKLRNVAYDSFLSQGFIPGENVNGFLYNQSKKDENEDEEETTFEGALVGNPKLIRHFGVTIYGRKSNSIFRFSVDFDMSSFYPSTIRIMNIDPSTLIFKVILDASQFDVRGGEIPFNGITDIQLLKDNNDSFVNDIGKEAIDNYQTKNILSTGQKWLNLPSLSELFDDLRKELD